MNILVLAAMLSQLLIGSVTYYSDGVMDRVYANRLEWEHVQPCNDCIGMIAVLDSDNLGKKAYIKRPNRPWEGPFLIVDCAARQDKPRLKARGLAAEVDYDTYLRWGKHLPYSIQLMIIAESSDNLIN